MTDEELALQDDQLASAKTREEKLDMWFLWWPHMARCIASLNRKIRELEEKLDTMRQELEALTKSVSALAAKVESLHAAPKWKDDKMGWLKANWQWLVIFLLAIKAASLEELVTKVLTFFAPGGA